MKPMTAATRVALLLVLSCSHKGAGGPARVPVTVARAEQRAVPYEIVATGTAEPRQTVAVQSQVTGVLTHVAFREGDRSEEHTSELQSHHDLVCRLLLEKKK